MFPLPQDKAFPKWSICEKKYGEVTEVHKL